MQNIGASLPERSLNWCHDTCFYKNGIFVADAGNSRVLGFETTPSVSNPIATNLIEKRILIQVLKIEIPFSELIKTPIGPFQFVLKMI